MEKTHENSLSFTDVRVSEFLFKRFEVALYVQKEADRSTGVELAFCFCTFPLFGLFCNVDSISAVGGPRV